MPSDGLDALRNYEAILFGSAGDPDISDHITWWGLRLKMAETVLFGPIPEPLPAFRILTDTKQPPSGALSPPARLSVEIDLHRAVRGRRHFVPVFANIHLGASVMATAGFAPAPENGHDRYSPAAPHESTRQPRLSDCHACRITRSGQGANGFTDESLGHELTGFFRPSPRRPHSKWHRLPSRPPLTAERRSRRPRPGGSRYARWGGRR